MGYRRVPTVTEVAEFSVRGGIVDVYGFGMSSPARCEWWGDVLASLRGFDLTTQRSLEDLDEVTVLPVAGAPRSEVAEPTGTPTRSSLLELLAADTLLVEEAEGPDADEVERAWSEAEHHLELSRRMGEEVPGRGDLYESPERWRERRAAFARLLVRDEAGGPADGVPAAGADRPGHPAAARAPGRRTADAAALRQRGTARSGSRNC